MQASISIELQMIDSAVRNVMYTLVPNNACVSATIGNTKVNLGRDILNCCIYLKNKINNSCFDSDDYECYLEMKQYYNSFISGCF